LVESQQSVAGSPQGHSNFCVKAAQLAEGVGRGVREVGLQQFDVPVDILEDSVPQFLEGLRGPPVELSDLGPYQLGVAGVRHRRGDSISVELKKDQIFSDSGSLQALLKVIIEVAVGCLLEVNV
jgi:hypothetical protein